VVTPGVDAAGKDAEKEAMVKGMVAAGEDVVYVTGRERLKGMIVTCDVQVGCTGASSEVWLRPYVPKHLNPPLHAPYPFSSP
jgi:hypothetical protein